MPKHDLRGQAGGRPPVATKHGAQVAAVIPIDAADLEDFVLAEAPRYLADVEAVDADLRAGHTRNGTEVFADLERRRLADLA